jgi:hypothetical protein
VRFTEREMTVAVDVVARQMFAATRLPWRRRGADEAWDHLPQTERYRRRSAVGEMVLPALQALPERPSVGSAPSFSNEEYAEAAAAATRALLEQRSPGSWDQLPERRRRRLSRLTAVLTRRAVAAMPVRQDPESPQVPDHL